MMFLLGISEKIAFTAFKRPHKSFLRGNRFSTRHAITAPANKANPAPKITRWL
jgi:hypothetical protein